MDQSTIQAVVKRTCEQYAAERVTWIDTHGDTDGFHEWFTAKVIGKPPVGYTEQRTE